LRAADVPLRAVPEVSAQAREVGTVLVSQAEGGGVISAGDLISTAYQDQQATLHRSPEGYGDKGDKWADAVRDLLVRRDAFSVLDYGCGQGTLARALGAIPGVRVSEYDPAIPGKSGMPSFADLVVCTDVLEHVEPDKLTSVLAHLKLLARSAVFVVVSTRPAVRTLADGRNAHLIVQPAAWWMETFAAAGFSVELGPSRPGKPSAHELSVVLT
jgi:hypothetical protein